MQRTHFKNHRLRTKMTELTRELMAMSPMCIVLLGAVENQQKNIRYSVYRFQNKRYDIKRFHSLN